ncbi:MAG: hypothetical protein GX877_05325 [Bacteroidales bacterium]|nr:hypothetical protein [Bacteroidales bacterium]
MKRILIPLLCVLFSVPAAYGQFAVDMGEGGRPSTQDTTVQAKEAFRLKTYFTALAGKDTLKLGRVFSGAVVLPGYAQAYHREYWKIPITYAGIGAGIYMGRHFHTKFRATEDDAFELYRNLCYVGAGLFYWGSLLDGVMQFKHDKPVLPARATLYSALLPGLGQIYNGDYWKVPIVYGGLIACGYFWQYNGLQYKRYKTMYNHAMANPPRYDGWMRPEDLKWYRDTFRRFRDYSILATVLVYALNIIDANVFAHFQDFDISDDLTLRIEPGFIHHVAYSGTLPQVAGIHMKLTF